MIRSIMLYNNILSDGLTVLYKVIKDNKWRLSFDDFLNVKVINTKEHQVIGKFITNNDYLRDELLDTKIIIENYLERSDILRPLNILLSAPPGSGKSFLLKQYSELFKTEYEEFNLSTLVKKEKIFDIFKYIQERNSSGITPIILIDEVDTLINNEYLFPYFISTMSDGKSKYNNQKIHCSKAVIAFAGSGLFDTKNNVESNISDIFKGNKFYKIYKLLVELIEELFNYHKTYYSWREKEIKLLKSKANKINKFPDFLDRIDLFLLLPPINTKLKYYSYKKELSDISVSLIRKHFDKVKKIELSYLVVIMTLLITFETKREADSVIFLTKNPSNETMLFKYFPKAINLKFKNIADKFGNKFVTIKL